MLENLSIILHRTKFPENVGSAARACANMGVRNLVLVAPQAWDESKAQMLATPKGKEILDRLRVEDDLAQALSGYHAVFASTARTGGWRRAVLTPAQAAPEVCACLAQGGEVALVFGPEDAGLTNEEIEICGRLVRIPTAPDASSLNLAQAVLVVLYECFKQAFPGPAVPQTHQPDTTLATHQEQELLFEAMRESLLQLDFIRHDNTDYWMLPVRRFLQRVGLRRNEFNLLMGVCRQVQWFARAKGGQGKE